MDRRRGHDVAGLVRVQDEDRSVPELARSTLDAANAGVAVLDRDRKLAGLKGRAHARVLGRGDPPLEDQRFGAAADAAVKGADQHVLVGHGRQRLAPDFAAARGGHPERSRFVAHVTSFCVETATVTMPSTK